DAGAGLTHEDLLLARHLPDRALYVANKIDLAPSGASWGVGELVIGPPTPQPPPASRVPDPPTHQPTKSPILPPQGPSAMPCRWILVSALPGAGLDELRRAIRAALAGGVGSDETVLVSNARHRARLEAAAAALRDAITGANAGADLAAIALDVK